MLRSAYRCDRCCPHARKSLTWLNRAESSPPAIDRLSCTSKRASVTFRKPQYAVRTIRIRAILLAEEPRSLRHWNWRWPLSRRRPRRADRGQDDQDDGGPLARRETLLQHRPPGQRPERGLNAHQNAKGARRQLRQCDHLEGVGQRGREKCDRQTIRQGLEREQRGPCSHHTDGHDDD